MTNLEVIAAIRQLLDELEAAINSEDTAEIDTHIQALTGQLQALITYP